MLTRHVIAAIGGVAALLISNPAAAHGAVHTEVICHDNSGCQVVATAAGSAGTSAAAPGGTNAANPRPAAAAAARTARSGAGAGAGPGLPTQGQGQGRRAASSPSAAGAASTRSPGSATNGAAATAVCLGATLNPVPCLGQPARARPAALAAAAAPAKGAAKTPPPPPPTPAELAAAAVATLKLPNPTIGSAPCTSAGCMGAVGVPVWLWTEPWTPKTATASIRGTSITATARITTVTWSMGDGSTVVCNSAGTPFAVSYGFTPSPDCGHLYTKTSGRMPGQQYPVTATATWNVTWTGDETGATTTTTLAATRFTIGELQSTIIN